MHEHTSKHIADIKGSSDRSFGLVFCGFFVIVAFFPLLQGGAIRLWSLAIAGFFLVFALLIPRILAPANRIWLKVGMLLHRIISPIALGIVYYASILPIGLIMRLFGKDPLRLRLDPAADTYWIKRDPSGPTADSLNNQF